MNVITDYIISLITVTIVLLVSCSEEDIPDENTISRTVIVYMAADNDLSADALSDLAEIKQGFSEKGVTSLYLPTVRTKRHIC
ncbi:MAG: hypothetical protein LBS52_01395 [Dysgonamonadaceae bacterium]|nr:hypothetical protein [Dysgonamonadaceae bacterium]